MLNKAVIDGNTDILCCSNYYGWMQSGSYVRPDCDILIYGQFKLCNAEIDVPNCIQQYVPGSWTNAFETG